jgi:hypothetical protein
LGRTFGNVLNAASYSDERKSEISLLICQVRQEINHRIENRE